MREELKFNCMTKLEGGPILVTLRLNNGSFKLLEEFKLMILR